MATNFEVGGNVDKGKQALKSVADEVKKVGTAADEASAKAEQLGDKVGQAGQTNLDTAADAIDAVEQKLEDASQAAEDLSKDLDKAADSAEGVGHATQGIGTDFQAIEKAVESQTQAVQDSSNAAAELADQVEKVGSAAGKATDTTTRLTALFTGFSAGVTALKLISRAATAVQESIHAAAESGNVDMKRLSDGIDNAGKAWDQQLARMSGSQTGHALTGFFADWMEKITGGVEGLHELGSTFDTFVLQGIRGMRSLVGANVAEIDKEMNKIAEMNRVSEMAFQDELRRKKVAKQEAEAQNIEDALKASRQRDAMYARIGQVTDLKQINAEINKQIQSAKDLAKEDDGWADKKQKAIEKINALEARRKQLIKESQDAEKKRAQDEQQHYQDVIAAEKEKAKTVADTHSQDDQRKQQAAQQAQQAQQAAQQQAQIQAQQAALAAKKAAFDAALAKAAPVTKGAADQIAAQAEDSEAVARRLAQQAGQAAMVEWRRKHQKQIDENNAALLRNSVTEEDDTQLQLQQNSLKYQEDQAGKDAERRAYRAASRQLSGEGPEVFKDKQILDAVQANTDATVNDIAAQSGLHQSFTASLQQQTQAIIQNKQDTLRTQQQVDAMQQLLDSYFKSLSSSSRNMSARRNGAKPF